MKSIAVCTNTLRNNFLIVCNSKHMPQHVCVFLEHIKATLIIILLCKQAGCLIANVAMANFELDIV